jgi:hypothetical protein
MRTTISINGDSGASFLSRLVSDPGSQRVRWPPVLERLASIAEHERDGACDVEEDEAEWVAEFLLEHASGAGPQLLPPLLFSAQIGDEVAIARDLLAEIEPSRRRPRVWRFVARGTRGKLVERDRERGIVLLLDGPHARETAAIRDRSMTRLRVGRVMPWPNGLDEKRRPPRQ